ncbi:hypothetical protein HDU96_009592 [Phlyctochytrium bullatum]|nr:hypothetical protein HDU96_009592 [Phlyctochytrium bullatum]
MSARRKSQAIEMMEQEQLRRLDEFYKADLDAFISAVQNAPPSRRYSIIQDDSKNISSNIQKVL